jgi:flagellar motility protein MotE (MotC chaperone)
MSSGASRIPPGGVRSLQGLGGGGPGIPDRSHLPPNPGGASRWLRGLVIVAVLLLGLTYVFGRTVEPLRLRLVGVPVAGKLLFAGPVWPVLWNKPVSAQVPTSRPADKSAAGNAGVAALDAEVAKRLADVEQRETDVARREAALKLAEPAAADQQRALDLGQAEAASLTVQLKGQLQTELDRVEVVRSMKSAAVVQLFGVMTDDEVIAVLKYMRADEVGKILSGLDQTRSARLLRRMQFVPAPTNP